MFNTRLIRITACIAAIAAAASASAQSPNRDNQKQSKQQAAADLEQCSKLMQYTVKSEDNQDVGSIRNVAVDVDTGQAFYVIIEPSRTGGMNPTQKLLAVPVKACRFNDRTNTCTLNVNSQRLNDAPSFDPAGWETVGDPKWGRVVHEFYSISWERQHGQESDRPGADRGAMLRLTKATDLMKMNCQLRQGQQQIGKCQDLLIDARRSAVPIVIIELDSGDRQVAVPYQLVRVQENQKLMIVRAERDQLAEAPAFKAETDLKNEQWITRVFEHYDVEPDFVYGYTPPDGDNRDDTDDDRDDQRNNRGNTDQIRADARESEGWLTRDEYGRLFNASRLTTVNGRVTQVRRIRPMEGMTPGVMLVVRTDNGQTQNIHLGPAWFVERQQEMFQTGDEVQVRGSQVSREGEQFIMATQVTREDRIMVLRNEQGRPTWDVWRPVTEDRD